MDFFDLSKEFKKIHLKGGQTQGFIKVEDEDFEDTNIETRSRKGKSYIKEYLLKEREEAELLHLAENSSLPSTSQVSAVELTSLGTFPDINEVEREELTQVYKEYYENKPKPNNKLVINDYKSKILSMIELNEITIITGPTGCGKTTQIPQFILDSYAEKNRHCNILVTQPRRIAAISIPKRVCEERDWPLGTICGYKIGLKDCTSEDTRLTYVTIGVFLQIIINSQNLNDYTHIILDEVHERDQNMDFSLLVIKKLLNSNSRNVKVILMSATADVGKFASYFEKRILGKLQPAPVISIGRTSNYIVQIHYLEELSPLGELPEMSFDNPCISEVAMMTCVKLIKQFERLDKDTKNKKSVLVFLPGIYEIEELFNKLKNPKIYNPGVVEYKWFPIPLHSSITAEEQALTFRPPPSGFRKIILATNIAESSITVPDVMFVIDFCLTKVLVTDTASNFTSLQLSWASKANCIQRAGRAGRVMEGRVYRMVYKNFYQKFEEQCIPDMLRCPLEKVILQSKLLNMGSPKAILALAVDPPDLSNIEKTVLILKEVGGLLLTCDGVASSHDGDLTYLGRLMALMPIDIHITRLIILGYLFSCLEQCIVMGAAMSLKSVFSSPFQARLKSYNSKLEWADGSCSDCIAFLNVYDVWRLNHTNGYFKRSAGGGEVGWAKRHFIQLRALKEVQILVDELARRLKMHNIERTAGVGRVQWNDVQKAFVLKFVIAGAFYPNYFGRGARGGQISEEVAVKTLGGRDPFTTVYLQNYPLEQPPELYSHLIKEKLAECKEEMKISYDNSSKVYIEFRKQEFKTDASDMPFNSEVPGKISMAVYRAVKMRRTLKYVEIKAMPPDQAKKVAAKLGLEKKNDTFLIQPSIDSTVKEKMFQSMIPGIDVNFIRINITHAIDPGHFWAVSKDGINDRYEREIFEMLNGKSAELEPYSKMPDVGEMCVAPYKDEEVWLYRARIDALLEKGNKWFAQVFFIDYGNTELVPVSDLLKYGRKLLPIIGKIPAQCFECVLTRVKPSLIKHSSGKWCDAAKKEFQKLIKNGGLIGSIYSVVGNVVSLILYKVDDCGTACRQININQHLVKEGYAEEIEESYLSKANNEIRRERQLDSDQTDAYNTLQMQENWLENSFQPPDLHDCKLTVGTLHEQINADDSPVLTVTPPFHLPHEIKVHLRIKQLKLGGPYSPLEMKVFSCCRGGLSKHVTISPSSVNSVLLDSDPQDPHERLVVAAHVSQNQTGSNLILHHTTILPNIHGLAALVPFVFAPTVELRVNEKRTKYTGILCGLGVDEHNRAMFPEHDMEVLFDCEFTFEDFSTINRLRFFMSLLLLADGDEIEPVHSHPDVVMFQNNIKNALTKLIDKHRPSQELEFPKKEFKWGLVHSDLIVSNETALNYSKISIFPLHPGVSITPNPNEKKNLLIHIENLHAMAKAKIEPQASIECELCSLPLIDLNSVRLHLSTPGHKSKEEKLKKSFK